MAREEGFAHTARICHNSTCRIKIKPSATIPKLVLAVAFFATVCFAAPFLRIGSGPLNTSVENERDAATDRAHA